MEMEFIGTFILVFTLGMLYFQHKMNEISLIGLGIGAFSVYSVLLWLGGPISGAQFNPAITLNLMFSRHLAVWKGVIFMGVQFFAATFATCALLIVLPHDQLLRAEEDTIIGFPLPKVGMVKHIFLEFLGTFFLVFSYYMLFLEKNAPKYVYGAGVAGVLFFNIMFSYELTGCAMNPARIFAYGLLGQEYSLILVSSLGALAGSVLGSILGNLLLSEKAMISKLKRLRRKEKKDRKRKTQQALSNK